MDRAIDSKMDFSVKKETSFRYFTCNILRGAESWGVKYSGEVAENPICLKAKKGDLRKRGKKCDMETPGKDDP